MNSAEVRDAIDALTGEVHGALALAASYVYTLSLPGSAVDGTERDALGWLSQRLAEALDALDGASDRLQGAYSAAVGRG